MEIQVRAAQSRRQSRRVRPLANPLTLLRKGELSLFHAGCGGAITLDADDPSDFECYATVRCNICFETNRERLSSIARALKHVLVHRSRSSDCTVLSFIPLSSRDKLTRSVFGSRLHKYLNGRG